MYWHEKPPIFQNNTIILLMTCPSDELQCPKHKRKNNGLLWHVCCFYLWKSSFSDTDPLSPSALTARTRRRASLSMVGHLQGKALFYCSFPTLNAHHIWAMKTSQFKNKGWNRQCDRKRNDFSQGMKQHWSHLFSTCINSLWQGARLLKYLHKRAHSSDLLGKKCSVVDELKDTLTTIIHQ